MNKVEVFNFETNDIRTVVIDSEAWFVGKDVADALGYTKSRNALTKHVDEDDALKWGVTDNLGRLQETTLINESGVYSLIFGSKLESAK
ncbi:Bro-N domain-containing protein [Leuconostoc mesenteroides]|uniref:BRO-N domain-containing protein n=1 Tax=Leuconostoc mesenteroides TaxID=1245 RepID=UPI003B5BBD1C